MSIDDYHTIIDSDIKKWSNSFEHYNEDDHLLVILSELVRGEISIDEVRNMILKFINKE